MLNKGRYKLINILKCQPCPWRKSCINNYQLM